MECALKALYDVKFTDSKTKNQVILRVGMAHAGCDPR